MTRRPWLALTLTLLAGCPQADEHSGHHHEPPGASGDVVALTPDQVRDAGIATVVVGPGTVSERLHLTATVQEDLDHQAHVTPKVPGLVKEVRAQLGDRVEPGQILCELESTALGEAASAYMEARASLQATQEQLDRERGLLERGVEVAETIFARETALKEQELTTLRPYYQAEKVLAEAKLERDRRVLALEAEVRQREILAHTAAERLEILGLDAEDLARLEKDEVHGHGRYPLRAPRAGVVVARDLTLNEYVDTSSKLFLVQDLSRVWVVASVYEKDLRKVARGQRARVQLEAFPGVTLEGEVSFLDYHLDPTTRACELRIELENRPLPGWDEPFPLRPGLFGAVDLVLSEREAPITVPEAALVHEGPQSYVFVALEPGADHDEDAGHDEAEGHDEDAGHDEAEGHDEHAGHDEHEAGPRERFARRRVELGARGDETVAVVSGLEPGERVVVQGTFTLKSVARQGELGGGHSH